MDLYNKELELAISSEKKDIPAIDSFSAYFGRRFCSSCCREWGSMDVLLDLVSIRTGKKRTEIMHSMRNFAKYGACCNRALFPNQHNISSYAETSLSISNSRILNEFPSSLRLTTSREKIGLIYPPGTQKPMVITRNVTLKQINDDFGALESVSK